MPGNKKTMRISACISATFHSANLFGIISRTGGVGTQILKLCREQGLGMSPKHTSKRAGGVSRRRHCGLRQIRGRRRRERRWGCLFSGCRSLGQPDRGGASVALWEPRNNDRPPDQVQQEGRHFSDRSRVWTGGRVTAHNSLDCWT